MKPFAKIASGRGLVDQVHTRCPTTAIIMSTAQDDPHTVRTSRKLGALAYVIKPFDPVMVRSALVDASVARTFPGDNGRKRERPLENV